MSVTLPITDEFIITKEFVTAISFSEHIEADVLNRGVGYIEALLEYCESRDIEPDSVASLVAPALREKLRAEAEGLHLLKRNTDELPFDD